VSEETRRMEKIRRDYKKCITASTWNENECNDNARPSSLFLEDFPYRARALSSLYSVSDVTVIHYYGLPNANARINIYYIGAKFPGYWDYPARIFRGVLLCNIWHLEFKFYKASQVSHGRNFPDAGRWSALSVNIVFYYAATLYCALLNL